MFFHEWRRRRIIKRNLRECDFLLHVLEDMRDGGFDSWALDYYGCLRVKDEILAEIQAETYGLGFIDAIGPGYEDWCEEHKERIEVWIQRAQEHKRTLVQQLNQQ